MYLTKQFFLSIVPQAVWQGPDFPEGMQLVVDSRQVTREQPTFFVALPGTHTDGHHFVNQALAAGACGVVVSQDISVAAEPHQIIIRVPEVLQALIDVARAWRLHLNLSVVGITGSVGKTTTKQLLGEIVKASGKKVLIAQGNQNTALGISLNIWRLTRDHEVAIFEMGISKKGEMARMADIVRPTLGVITYVGHSHSQGLGTVADIAAEKQEIFSYFNERSIGIVNGDLPELATACPYPLIKFGKKMIHQVQMRKVVVHDTSITGVLKIYQDKYPLRVPTTNTAFLNSLLAASAAAHALGIDHATIVDTAQKPLIVPGRYEKRVLPANGGLVFHDAYNASPESMKSALLAFEKVAGGKKVALLGDMLELGHLSGFWHRQIGRFLKKVPSLTHLILVGTHVEGIKKTAPVGLSCTLVPTWKEALEEIKPLLGPDTAVLLKASRGIALNNIVEHLEKQIS